MGACTVLFMLTTGGNTRLKLTNTDSFHSASIGRKVLGRELATIHDYRQRLGQYRTDVSLLDAHQAHPWITVW